MNPSDANSPLATLRQLKEMLDAGTLTPAEFEALKQQLVFGGAALTAPAAPGAPETPEVPDGLVGNIVAALPSDEPLPYSIAEDSILAAYAAPEATASAAAPGRLAPATAPASYPTEAQERRNPLTLVFAIGGALVLLGLVLYLFVGRPATPDEHLTSTSQTAADSAAVAPEVGPQAQQITLPPATPETIRVAPPTPPPAAAASQLRADSVAVPAATPAKAPVPAPATPPKAAAPAKAAPASPPAPDSATKTSQP